MIPSHILFGSHTPKKQFEVIDEMEYRGVKFLLLKTPLDCYYASFFMNEQYLVYI